MRGGDAERTGRRRDRARGWALPVVLLLLVILLLAGTLVASNLLLRMNAVKRQSADLHLQALADSGLSLAMAWVAANRYSSTEAEVEIGGGRVRYRIEIAPLGMRNVEIQSFYGPLRRDGLARLKVPNDVDPIQLWLWRLGGARLDDDDTAYSPPIIPPPSNPTE